MGISQNNHQICPTTCNLSDVTVTSSATPERTLQQRDHSSLQKHSCTDSCPDHMNTFQGKHFNLPKVCPNESSTGSEQFFQSKSENLLELASRKVELNLGIVSNWTSLQHVSQEESIDSVSKQIRQKQTFCFVFSENLSCEESLVDSTSQRTQTSPFHFEPQAKEDLTAKKCSPESVMSIRTEENYRLGYFYHRFSGLYKTTSNQLLQASSKVISQARHIRSLCNPSRFTSPVATLVRSLPLLKHLPLDSPLLSYWVPPEPHSSLPVQCGRSSSEKPGHITPYRPQALIPDSLSVALSASLSSSVFQLEYKDSGKRSALKQTLVTFPDQMLKLQEFTLEAFLEHVTCSLPELSGAVPDIRGIYWLAVANCTAPNPQPACLLLLHSTLYALILSDNHPGSMGIFHALPLSSLQEIQIGFGGQSVQFLDSAESCLLTVFSYNKDLCQQICRDILCVLMPESEAAAYSNHPLLQQDLVQLSLDWKTETPDLVLANGVRLSSKFHNTLVDLIYILHGNMEGITPSLAEIQLLLYTTVQVKVDSNQDPCLSLVLLNTHIALVREHRVFYPCSGYLNVPSTQVKFNVYSFRSLMEFRCCVVPQKKNMPVVKLIFIRKPQLPADSGNGRVEARQEARLFTRTACIKDSRNVIPETWDLTFNCEDEALWLVSHLTMLWGEDV